MTLYALILFLHLTGVVALFLAFGIEWAAISFLVSANSAAEAQAWLRLGRLGPLINGPALLLVILSGGYLASIINVFKQGWIPATLLAIFLALAVGFAMILPRMKRIRAALPAGPTGNVPLPESLRAQLSDPVLLTAIRVRFLIAIGIVYLMAAKMPFLPSLIALVIAIAIGFVLSLSTWSRPQSAPTTS